MTKTEYMKELSRRLRPLPKEDFQKAIDYFEEYFADAGPENEAQVIEDLGTPEFAARQLVTNLAISNTKEPTKDVKKGLSAVWVGILALCAAPIALPLAFVVVLLVALFLFTILLLLGSLGLMGIAAVITGPLNIIAGFTVLSQSLPVFLSCLGSGLLLTGIGLLISLAALHLCQRFLTAMIHLFGHIIKKGGKTHAQNQ